MGFVPTRSSDYLWEGRGWGCGLPCCPVDGGLMKWWGNNLSKICQTDGSDATLTGSSLTFQLKASSIADKSFWDVAKSVGTAQQLTDGVSPLFSTPFSGRAGFEMNVVGDQLVVEAEVWITLIQKGV